MVGTLTTPAALSGTVDQDVEEDIPMQSCISYNYWKILSIVKKILKIKNIDIIIRIEVQCYRKKIIMLSFLLRNENGQFYSVYKKEKD